MTAMDADLIKITIQNGWKCPRKKLSRGKNHGYKAKKLKGGGEKHTRGCIFSIPNNIRGWGKPQGAAEYDFA